MVSIKVAIVCDRITTYGGAEKVLKTLHSMFPNAPIYTLYADNHIVSKHFSQTKVHTTFLQKFPSFLRGRFKFIAPFAISAVENIDVSQYNVVISCSSFFAKGVITSPQTLHISYCHTPARALWGVDEPTKKTSILSLPFLHILRIWDVNSAHRVDSFVANSTAVQKRIAKYYRKNATVIHPPVEVQEKVQSENYLITTKAIPSKFFLVVSNLYEHKRLDVAIQAFNKMKYPLVIIGDGPLKKDLQRQSGSNIIFVGHQPDDIIADCYKRCFALIHPAEEDFGMSMVEANMFGKPVLAYAKGGSEDIIQNQDNGVLFFSHNPFVFSDALRILVDNIKSQRYNEHTIKSRVEQFHTSQFTDKMRNLMKQELVHFFNNDKQYNQFTQKPHSMIQ